MSQSRWNSDSRYGIDTTSYTIKFKTMYHSFEFWKTNLIKYGVPEEKIEESDFLIIRSLIGNAYLLYNVGHMNIATLALNFKKYDFIRDKEKKLTNLSLEELMEQSADNQNINYVINQIKEPINYDKFVNGSNKMIHKSQDAKINKINEIKKFNEMGNPDMLFIARLVNSIVLPFQPRKKGWKKNGWNK